MRGCSKVLADRGVNRVISRLLSLCVVALLWGCGSKPLTEERAGAAADAWASKITTREWTDPMGITARNYRIALEHGPLILDSPQKYHAEGHLSVDWEVGRDGGNVFRQHEGFGVNLIFQRPNGKWVLIPQIQQAYELKRILGPGGSVPETWDVEAGLTTSKRSGTSLSRLLSPTSSFRNAIVGNWRSDQHPDQIGVFQKDGSLGTWTGDSGTPVAPYGRYKVYPHGWLSISTKAGNGVSWVDVIDKNHIRVFYGGKGEEIAASLIRSESLGTAPPTILARELDPAERGPNAAGWEPQTYTRVP